MAKPEEVWFGWMSGKQFRLTKNYGELADQWKGFDKGVVVKAVMVSRMGDVGVTLDLGADSGYDLRVMPFELEPITPIPTDVCPLCHLEFESGDHAKCSRERKCERCSGETGPGDPVCRTCLLKEWREGRG